MTRPVTLFTGQWADLPLETLRRKGGVVGLRRPRARLLGRSLRGGQSAWQTTATCARVATSSSKHGLKVFAISNHLVGQAVCDRIDDAAQEHPPAARLGRWQARWRAAPRGRGDDEHRAGGEVVRRGRRAGVHRLLDLAPALQLPARRAAMIDAGFHDFAKRWNPILDAFDEVRRALRARGASDGDRLRRLVGPARARRSERTHGVRLQLRPEPFRLSGRGLRRRSSSASPTGSTTSHMKDVWWSTCRSRRACSADTSTSATADRFWEFRSHRAREDQLRGDHSRT